MFVLACFVALVTGILLTAVIVAWAARRLSLPVSETLIFFGLIEQPAEAHVPPGRRPPSELIAAR